jgi:hypothetical protein
LRAALEECALIDFDLAQRAHAMLVDWPGRSVVASATLPMQA